MVYCPQACFLLIQEGDQVMVKEFMLTAVVLGTVNTVLAIWEDAQKYEVWSVPLGGWFWIFRYYWRVVTLVAVVATYHGWLKIPASLPVITCFGYEIYLICFGNLRNPTPQSWHSRFSKVILFNVIPVLQLLAILRWG